jgi:hypothetical protein
MGAVKTKRKTPVKTIIATAAVLLSLLLGHHQQHVCMDPNANVPIDCSLVGK